MDALTVPESTLNKWQTTVDVMAQLLNVPAGLIMRITGPDIKVFVSSHSEQNPYQPGDKEHLVGSGLYCERVINTRDRLSVPNALQDPEWSSNPDIKLDMISYLGFPIMLPSGDVFGTICILDSKPMDISDVAERVVLQFKEMVENHLSLLQQNLELAKRLEEIKTLRGIVPICAHCKEIRDDEGFWQAVEQYLELRSEAKFTHGICPKCMIKHYPELS